MINALTLRAWARELGFAQAALCSPDRFDAAREMVSRQKTLAERRQLRFDPKLDHPQAKSLAVLLWPYTPAAAVHDKQVFVDSYYFASNAAYHAARKLEARLTEAGCYACANVSYPAKDAALRAGLGLIGKSSLLITQQYGTRVVILLLATDIPLDEDTAETEPPGTCIACGRCAAACPSGAIDEHGMSHPEKCLRNFMLEGIVVPEHLRSKIGMKLIGCDVCQRVCPMQTRFERAQDVSAFTLDMFMTTDAAAFSDAVMRLAEQIGRNTARPQRVRAQAALLAGNLRNPAYLPVLHVWSQSEFEAVREHALWAIRQIESCEN